MEGCKEIGREGRMEGGRKGDGRSVEGMRKGGEGVRERRKEGE